ncbi:hypothetical protein [Sphingobacterium multivorum]|uniref:hypothetical protein n=1 Tax=Sphingobacterium multivorum TaxID=28454 RepID=UPI002898AC33|nr:hypothetical protein [Sphingobacterium multivorum]
MLSRRAANKIVAPIFSGEELVNDLVRRNEIEKINPLAKGGEMEGAGLYAAANGQSEWILVKGICDYADGNKDKDKDDNQVIAMSSALSLCLEVFSSITSFTHINLFPANSTPVKTLSIEPTLVNNVLFDVYDVSKEKYYLLRDIDENVIKSMNYTSIWVSGKSGRGKSLALFRNLIKGKIDYISVSLASCTGLSIDEFFYEIYVELMLKLNPSETIERITDYRTIVRKINQILLAHYPGKTIFILIDEIPLGNDERFKDFVCKICSLFISSLLSCSGVTVRYALSSIYSPEEHIPEYQSKVRNYIKFIDFADWNETECHQLVNMIESELDITVSESTKRSIVEKSSGSPRWIKNVVKNVVILGDTSDTSVDEAIKQTKCQKVI